LEAARERRGDEPSILVRSATGDRRCTRVAVVNTDMPFLVDSIAGTVAARGLAIDLLVHPVLAAKRDGDGRLTALPEEPGVGARRESLVYLETPRIDARARRALERDLATTLTAARAAGTDWPEMRELIAQDADRVDDAEGAELLRWFGEGALTLLGHVTVARDGSQSQRRGIARKGATALVADETLAAAFDWFDKRRGEALLIVKANRLARVHRRVPLDLFIVPHREGKKAAALSIHAGMWTSAALATRPDRVPLLRRHLEEIGKSLDIQAGGHDAKALVHALTVLPHDLVIGFSQGDLERVTTAMMAGVDRPRRRHAHVLGCWQAYLERGTTSLMAVVDGPRPRLAFVTAPLRRHLFAFVWLQRDMMSTAARLQIQNLLESATGADTLDWSLQIEGSNLAMLRYVLDSRGQDREPDFAAIDARFQEMLRGWPDAVEAALAEAGGASRAAALAARYAEAFPQTYRADYGPAEAAQDIERLRRLASGERDCPLGRDARLYRL